MGDQLGRIDGDAGAVSVGDRGGFVDGRPIPGDVGRAGERHEPDTTAATTQRGLERGEVQAAVTVGLYPVQSTATLPRQQVRVVLHRGHDHHIIGLQPERVRDHVQALGRRLREQHPVADRVGAQELPDDLAALLVHLGRQPGLEPRTAMDAGIPIQELVDRVTHDAQRRRGRRVVQVHIAQPASIGDGHQGVGAHPIVGVDGRVGLALRTWRFGGRSGADGRTHMPTIGRSTRHCQSNRWGITGT